MINTFIHYDMLFFFGVNFDLKRDNFLFLTLRYIFFSVDNYTLGSRGFLFLGENELISGPFSMKLGRKFYRSVKWIFIVLSVE